MPKDSVTIRIMGPVGSGKSTVGQFINEALLNATAFGQNLEFTVVTEGDVEDIMSMNAAFQEYRLEALKGLRIVIEEVQTKRPCLCRGCQEK